MTKIVINVCYGGFGLSLAALEMYYDKKGVVDKDDHEIDRTDPILIEVVETLGKKANGSYAELVIEELEPGTLYRIDEYDGLESIETQQSIEWKVA